MLRSVGSVAAGYFMFAASAVLLFQMSGRDPHAEAPLAFKAATVIWGAVFALVAGWLTARIAGRRPATHAAVLAGVIALGAIVSMVTGPGDAMWSQIAAAVVMAPCAWLGGVIAERRRVRSSTN
jgi:hypothetical protein